MLYRQLRWARITPDVIARTTDNPAIQAALTKLTKAQSLRYGSSLQDSLAIDVVAGALRIEHDAARAPLAAAAAQQRHAELLARPARQLTRDERIELVAHDMAAGGQRPMTFPADISEGIHEPGDAVFTLAQRTLRERMSIAHPPGDELARSVATRELLERLSHGVGAMSYSGDDWAPLGIARALERVTTWTDPAIHPFSAASRDRLLRALHEGEATLQPGGGFDGLYAPIIKAAKASFPDAANVPAIAKVRALEGLAILANFADTRTPISHLTLELAGTHRVYGAATSGLDDATASALQSMRNEDAARMVRDALAAGTVPIPVVDLADAGLDAAARARAVLANHVLSGTHPGAATGSLDEVAMLDAMRALVAQDGVGDAARAADLVYLGARTVPLENGPLAVRISELAEAVRAPSWRPEARETGSLTELYRALPVDPTERTTWIREAIARRANDGEPNRLLSTVLELRPDLVPTELGAQAAIMRANDMLRAIDVTGVRSSTAPKLPLLSARRALDAVADDEGASAVLAADTRTLVDRNLARIDGTYDGPARGYSNYADLAEVGRVRTSLELLERVQATRPVDDIVTW